MTVLNILNVVTMTKRLQKYGEQNFPEKGKEVTVR